jgi:hypothetical protein
VMDALQKLDRKGARAIDVKAEVQEAFNADLQAKLKRSVWGSGCASWYLTPDGKNRALWPDYTFAFRKRTKHVVESDVAFMGRRD